MATVIVASDIDPTLQIRITRLGALEWGGKCPGCRNTVSVLTTYPAEFLGRGLAIQAAVSHLDQEHWQ